MGWCSAPFSTTAFAIDFADASIEPSWRHQLGEAHPTPRPLATSCKSKLLDPAPQLSREVALIPRT